MEPTFSQRIQGMRQRIQALRARAQDHAHQPDLLSKVFDELERAIETLQAIERALVEQQAQQITTNEQLETERHTYKELFDAAPVAYLVTSPNGVICRVNQAATTLFEAAERQLLGRSLTQFLPDGARRLFRRSILKLSSMDGVQVWCITMKRASGQAFDGSLSVAVVRNRRGKPVELRWMIMTIGQTDERDEPATGGS